MNGIMMGLSPREARKRFDAVIDFAELQEFKELKLKNYSSGMQVRLAFSVAIQVDADVLLIDEVLAVGDAAFQQKCFDVFYRMRDQGKTILFVTHDMVSMQRFCHRAMLLEDGAMVHIGDPKEVADQYLELNFGRDPQAVTSEGGHVGDGDARVTKVWVEDEQGQSVPAVPQGTRVTLRVLVEFRVDVEDPQASVYIHNEDHRVVLIVASFMQHERTGSYRAGEQVLFSFTFDNVLAPGRYSPAINLAHRGPGLDVIDRYERGFSFVVSGASLGGMVDVPVDSSVERFEAPVAEVEAS
jgi:ABC-type sulfate/molybdate transport systems ATPase subunit